jgi:uncharacterized protein with HEPN domain
MQKDDLVRLRHMLDAARDAVLFTNDLPPLIIELEKIAPPAEKK